MTKRNIKAYTVVREQYGEKFTIFAITSEGARRVNGHYVNRPEYGSHVTHNQAKGRYLELAEAEAKVAIIEAVYAEHRPGVSKAYNEYVRLNDIMNAAVVLAAQPEKQT